MQALGYSITEINSSDIESVIIALSDSASIGIDNISTKMLKLSCKAVSGVLADKSNYSVAISFFLASGRTAIVLPIFKKGDLSNMNYLPVALLPVLSKVFERIIAKQLSDYLEGSSVLSLSQVSFHRGFSTESALLRLSKLLFTARQAGQYATITTIDFTKAFESLSRTIFYNRLGLFSFSESAVTWFNSYLSNRYTYVRFGGVFFDHLPISYGVPTGSVLGPHLFNIYGTSIVF